MMSDVTHVDRGGGNGTGKPPRLPGRLGMAIKALRAAATPDAANSSATAARAIGAARPSRACQRSSDQEQTPCQCHS